MNTDTAGLVVPLWCGFFNETLDTLPEYSQKLLNVIRAEYFTWPWNRVYDFLEFVPRNDENLEKDVFMEFCNKVLEEKKSAYRFVSGLITPITDEVEVESIETAIKRASPLSGVKAHIREALAKLSDRDKPDYRNSIKESISAVEALLQTIAGKPNAKFSTALNAVGQKIQLHKALAEALSHLYGYTSNEKGIRHGMHEELSQTFGGAKFMLALCTAFVNYLIIRCGERGIALTENQKR
ncbi:hypothetical protein ES703_81184 [subsurface metagenome]